MRVGVRHMSESDRPIVRPIVIRADDRRARTRARDTHDARTMSAFTQSAAFGKVSIKAKATTTRYVLCIYVRARRVDATARDRWMSRDDDDDDDDGNDRDRDRGVRARVRRETRARRARGAPRRAMASTDGGCFVSRMRVARLAVDDRRTADDDDA